MRFRFKAWPSILAAGLAVLFLSTCGKESPTEPPGPSEPPPPASVATRITITPSSLAFTSLATTQNLSAVVYDQNGQVMSGAALTWTSSNTAVATVTAQGVVRSIGVGNARITVRSGNASATVEVKVGQTAASIRLSPSMLTIMDLGGTGTFRATVLDAGGTAIPGAQVAWTSSDSTVATVNAEGLVTAVGSGMADITATSNGATAKGTVLVALRPAALQVAPATARLTAVGETLQLVVMAQDVEGDTIMNPAVEWASSDESVAGVSAEGLVTAHRAGRATITASLGSLEATAEIEVALPPHRIAVTPSSIRFDATGQTVRLSAEVFDAHDEPLPDASVSWSSDDPSVATVEPADPAASDDPAESAGPAATAGTAASISTGPAMSISDGPSTLVSTDPAFSATSASVDPATSASDTPATSVGTVTAVSGGTTRIAARSGDATGYAEVTVNLDRQALAALYDATDGPNWDRNDNWLDDGPLDQWYGVTTRPDGRVDALRLERNNLVGPIPDELYDLKGLTVILAYGNELSGSLSPEIGGLSELETFHLAENGLTGALPPELGNLGNLYTLDLHGNGFSGTLPSRLGDLTRLVVLSLAGNDLEGPIPPELGKLVNLRQFIMSETMLSGPLPDTITALENLETIWLQGTRVCVPSSEAFNRWLNRIPYAIVTPCDNPDKAALVELYHATDGPNWKDGTNWLSEKPLREWKGVSVDNFGRVEHLHLDGNGLRGEFPAGIVDLEFLSVLFLEDNELHGKIPTELGGLRNLVLLWLSGNNLDGPIPPDLGKLPHLEYLYLDTNELDGAIPSELGELVGLKGLYLQRNRLSGQIPPELGRMSSLQELNLGRNLLTGELPSELSNLSNLKEMVLSGNEGLTGELPPALVSLDLEVLLAEQTGLCLPEEVDYASWILGYRHVRVERCDRPVEMGLTAYLTQATQSFDYPVPLVAGDPALLRVFLTADDGDVEVPPVRVSFYQNESNVHTADIPGRAGFVPPRVDESDLALSSNAEIPGSILAPGLEMVVEIDPDDTRNLPAAVKKRLPETGRIELDVKTMPPFDLVMVPFLWEEDPDHGFVSRVEALTAEDEIFGKTRDLLPVGAFNLEVHAPVWTSVDPLLSRSGGNSRVLTPLFQELEVIQAVEGTGREYYMGMLREYGGSAVNSGYTTLASLHETVIAHELGHNLSLSHTGCTWLSPDPNYPYEDGAIGSWGYDIRTGTLVSPETTCLMSYCGSEWIGEYSFSKALYYRLSEDARLASGSGAAAPGLLVWGGVTDDGEMTLEPAFALNAEPSLPAASGPYRLYGEDGDGRVLFTLRFPMRRFAHEEGGVFAFIMPVRPERISGLKRITLSGPEGAVEITRDGGRSAALMIDRYTGEVRGILREWLSPDGSFGAARRTPPEPGLDVIISRGIP